MEVILVLLLIYLIFRDVTKEDISSLIKKFKKEEEKPDKRQEELKKEFNNMMDYSIDKAIQSKRGEVDGQ